MFSLLQNFAEPMVKVKKWNERLQYFISKVSTREGVGGYFLKKEKSITEDMTNGIPVPELSFLPAPYEGWTQAGEKKSPG